MTCKWSKWVIALLILSYLPVCSIYVLCTSVSELVLSSTAISFEDPDNEDASAFESQSKVYVFLDRSVTICSAAPFFLQRDNAFVALFAVDNPLNSPLRC